MGSRHGEGARGQPAPLGEETHAVRGGARAAEQQERAPGVGRRLRSEAPETKKKKPRGSQALAADAGRGSLTSSSMGEACKLERRPAALRGDV